MVFAERPMSLTPRLVNSDSSLAKAPSSVVQTGVKSSMISDEMKHKAERCVCTLGVREENNPFVSNELMELDGALGIVSESPADVLVLE